MTRCQYLDDCYFFNHPSTQNIPVLTDQLKIDYCHGRFDTCARHEIAIQIGKEHVPPMMLPTQHQWAEMILRRHGEAAQGTAPEQK